ncbi:MAG: glycosyltransferase [Nostocaceae cyanobacterium]|nr:glycosyltransferase [Nostocaceae cyanobacterium]
MKITFICHDIPYPPIHGARVDTWRRIKAFSKFGVELQLICWSSEQPKPEEIAEIQQYVQKLHAIAYNRTIGSSIQRIIDLRRYPLEVTSRILRGQDFNNLLAEVRAFNPDVIWSDYVHCGELALQLKKDLQVPIISRSHNIEHLYYRRLFESATDIKSKIRRYFSVSNLEHFEKNILKNSAFFYDISADDLKFWQQQGFTNGRYLPPFVEFTTDNQSQEPEYDIVFLGNLNTDNNVAGVTWFITQVFPIIRSTFPEVKLLIAGSRPVKKIQQLCEEHPGIYLSINPPSSTAVYNSGRVLINPIATGSGVSIKSLEMLMSGRAIVSTPQGIAGLPESIQKYFQIAVDEQSFAKEVIQLLSNPQEVNVERELLESLFGFQAIKGVVEDINELLKL